MNNTKISVGIAGVGGIGSNVAKILVRSGVKNLKIVDFDTVESSNLNRQFYFLSQIGKPKVDMLEYNLKKIGTKINLRKEKVKISTNNIKSLFSEYKIIVEGFDSKSDKIMLLEELSDNKNLIVSASGIAGSNMNKIRVKKLGQNCYIVGDFRSDSNNSALFPPKIFCIASIMAGIVLRHIKLKLPEVAK